MLGLEKVPSVVFLSHIFCNYPCCYITDYVYSVIVPVFGIPVITVFMLCLSVLILFVTLHVTLLHLFCNNMCDPVEVITAVTV